MSARASSSRMIHGRGRTAVPDAARGWRAEEIAAKSPYLLERDPKFDQQVERRRRGGGVVLAVEHTHGVVKGVDRLEWALPARGALIMMHRHARHVHNPPTILLNPVSPVQVL